MNMTQRKPHAGKMLEVKGTAAIMQHRVKGRHACLRRQAHMWILMTGTPLSSDILVK